LFWQYLILINTSIFAIILALIDYKTQLLPNKWILSLLISNLFLMFFTDNYSFLKLIFTIFQSFLIFLFYLIVYFLSKRTFGLGDVKYSFALSMPLLYFYSFNQIISLHLSAFILGGVFSIYLIVFKSFKSNQAIAFGPFMTIAYFLFLVLNL
jgi:prepilin signal peptidase PulO-like enzyme (type II secretory pathway)